MTYGTDIHEAQQEALRDLSAPIGSRWQREPGAVWELVERNGSAVLLRSEHRHKSGLLHNLLKYYSRVPT